MPFPNTRVIPTGWAAHHRPVVESTFTAACTIRHPGSIPTGPFNPETGTTPSGPRAAHHTGSCRIQVLPALEQEAVTGEQEVTTLGYLVVVEWNASPEIAVNDLVKITGVDDNGDPTLVGRELTVRSFTRGSLAWERDLICTDNLG